MARISLILKNHCATQGKGKATTPRQFASSAGTLVVWSGKGGDLFVPVSPSINHSVPLAIACDVPCHQLLAIFSSPVNSSPSILLPLIITRVIDPFPVLSLTSPSLPSSTYGFFLLSCSSMTILSLSLSLKKIWN